jgi:hypothetical protein
VTNEIDGQVLEQAIDSCGVQLEQDFNTTSRERKNENADRVSFQIQSAERHRDRQLNTHYEVLEKLKARGNHRLIPARQGLIRNVQERFDVQVEKLRNKAELSCAQFDVCIGVLLVE